MGNVTARSPDFARVVGQICGHEKLINSSETDVNVNDYENGSMDGDSFKGLIADLASPCEDLLLRCHFEGSYFNCSKLFRPTLTDEGLCCSFNIMSAQQMFRKTDQKEADNGSDGIPWLAKTSGLHMGLSVALDSKVEDYFCTGHESTGFKLLLHSSSTLPEMTEHGFALSPGTEAFYAVSPIVTQSQDNINDFSVDKRGCFTHGERQLDHFRHYSYQNCFAECVARYTQKMCGCVAYHMPRDPFSSTPLCPPNKSDCILKSVRTSEENTHNNSHPAHCDCLPSCSDVEYLHESSTGKISRADLLRLPDELKAKRLEYSNDTYVGSNLSVLHIYFKSMHFVSRLRSESFGFVDFFSNIGGLLGLGCGLSIVSVAEVVYFFTLRVYYDRQLNNG